jgi:hypothetical protein
MMTVQEKNLIASRIIELDLEITRSVINGHKPSEDDEFKEIRQELNLLRCLYFGYRTKFCNIKKGFHGTPFS